MNSQRFSISLFAFSALCTLASAPAKAQTAAIVWDSMLAAPDSNKTVGWSFNVTAPAGISVVGLSLFDLSLDGFFSAHQVGIWNSAGTLLASVSMPLGTVAPFDSSSFFRYVSITPLTLPLGNNYTVGASYGSPNFDEIAYSISGNVTLAPGISRNGGGLMNVGASLTRPTSNLSPFANFGGGGSFVVGAAPSSSAPEPRTLALLSLGGTLVLIRRRRQRTGA